MRRTKVIGRFLFISSVVFGLSTIANWNEWNQYWNGTLRRVQTVDFNMLSHTLPAKLSSVLANRNYQELQQTLDSNYGLFGMIVTDCKKVESLCQEQKIIFASNGRKDWKILPASDNLSNHPFDLLRTPSPLIAEKSYENPSSKEQTLTKGSNEGIIIGRVYYVRGVAPDFTSDYISWLRNVWSTKGSHGFYALKTGSLIGIGLAVWLSIEFLLYKKHIERQQSIQEQKRLQEELSIEINRNSELLTHQESLINQQEKSRNDLEHSRKTYQQQVEELSTKIAQLTSSQSQQQSTLQAITQLLIIRQDELNAAHTSGNFTQEQLLHKENEIAQLQQQMDGLEHQKQGIISQRSVLQRNLDTIRPRLDDANRQIQNLESQINALSFERDRSLREVDDLKKKLATAPDVTGLTLVLKAAQLETARTKELHEENMQIFESLYKELEEENLNLKSEQDDLQLEVWNLEEQLKLFKDTSNQAEIPITELFTCPSVKPIIDLSSISIALVGGGEDTRRNIIQRLSQSYYLKEIREVPPTSEKYANTNSVRETIRGCHIIAVVTKYTGHNLTNIISNLEVRGNLEGEIIYLNTRGVSGISRDISIHLDKLNIQHNLN